MKTHFLAKASDNQLKKMATYASVLTALILISIKMIALNQAYSVSLLSSLIDSTLDSLASLVSLVAVRHAMQPADKEHRFGHGKIEALAGLGQFIIIILSALYVMYEAMSHFYEKAPSADHRFSLVVMGVSTILTLLLVWFQSAVIKQTRSIAIAADSAHYKADTFINIGVILAIIATSWTGLAYIDSLFGLGIALYIIISTLKGSFEAFNVLMDRELSDKTRQEIKKIILKHPEAVSFHELRTRSSGTKEFIQVHIVMPDHFSIHDAHRVSDEIERNLKEKFPRADILIHQDPKGVYESHAQSQLNVKDKKTP